MLSKVTKRDAIVAAFGLAAGLSLGYIFARLSYKKIAEQEIEEARQDYIKLRSELYSKDELDIEVNKQVAEKLSKPFKVEGTFGDKYLEKLETLHYAKEMEQELLGQNLTTQKVKKFDERRPPIDMSKMVEDSTLSDTFHDQRQHQDVAHIVDGEVKLLDNESRFFNEEDLNEFQLVTDEDREIAREIFKSEEVKDMVEDLPGVKEIKALGLGKVQKDKPYIISVEEFLDDFRHYDKISITYFEDGETLIDDNEEVINDNELVVGSENLKHFGVGSGSEDLLYVRNPLLKADFEVARDERSYLECVLRVDK